MLWQAITVLEARDVLTALNVSDFPHWKTGRKQEFHGAFVKASYPFAKRRPLDWNDVADKLGQTGTKIHKGAKRSGK